MDSIRLILVKWSNSVWKAILDKSGRDLSRSVETRTVGIFLGRSRFFSDGRDFSQSVEIFSDGRDFSREIINFSYRVEFFPRTVQLFLQFDCVAEKLRINGAVDVSE